MVQTSAGSELQYIISPVCCGYKMIQPRIGGSQSKSSLAISMHRGVWQPFTKGRLGHYILTCEDRSCGMLSRVIQFDVILYPAIMWRATEYPQYVNKWEMIVIAICRLDDEGWDPTHSENGVSLIYGHFHREKWTWELSVNPHELLVISWYHILSQIEMVGFPRSC